MGHDDCVDVGCYCFEYTCVNNDSEFLIIAFHSQMGCLIQQSNVEKAWRIRTLIFSNWMNFVKPILRRFTENFEKQFAKWRLADE